VDTVLQLQDVHEYIRELLHDEYLQVVTSLIADPKGKNVSCGRVDVCSSGTGGTGGGWPDVSVPLFSLVPLFNPLSQQEKVPWPAKKCNCEPANACC
jgi:hypothetical protein